MKRKKDFTWETGWTMTRFSRLLHQFSGKFPTAPDWAGETSQPAMDIFEDETDIHIHLDVPGMERRALEVSVDDNRLIIQGFKHGTADAGCLRYICVEREFGIFRRIVEIPGRIDASGVRAFLRDGVLEVRLPKIIERRRKIVPVPIAD